MSASAINPFLLLMIGVPISMLIIPFAWKLAPMLGMLDKPDARKVHAVPIPRIGGWGIVAGSLSPMLMVLEVDRLLQSFVIGALTLFVFGLWDDAKQISHWIKFVGQFAAAASVVYFGGLYVVDWPFIGDAVPNAWSKAFTVVAIMGMVNAINHSDGLDGLAGGESMLSLVAIAYLGYLASDDLIIALALSTMGGIVGFLRYNTHPAQVFMGDSGSQFLGFSLAFFAVYLTQVGMPAMSSASPLLFLGLPISDILVVLYKRAKGKMNWFKATRNHVHHRLLDLGFDHYETVVVIYSVQALLVTLAVLLRYQSDFLVASTYFGIIISFFLVLSVAESRGWRRRTRGESGLAFVIEALRRNETTKNLPLRIISWLLPMFVVAGAWTTAEVPRDFGVVSGVLAVITVVELVLRREQGSLAMRLSIYVAAVFSSFLFAHFGPTGDSPVHLLSVGLIVLLAAAVGVFIRYTSDQSFGSTPTDYLIVFGVLALLVFGGINSTGRATVQTIIYSVVLLYACEAMLWHPMKRFNPLALATVISLLTLAVRGLTDLDGPILRIALN